MRWLSWTVVSCVAAGCGGSSSPAAPGGAAGAGAPSTFAIAGTLTATNGQQPLSGATVVMGSISAVADGAGHYSLTEPAGSASLLALNISGNGLITRQSGLSLGNRTVNLDAIMNSGGFDLGFYREMVRNGFEAPSSLEPLRRWTRAPIIYLKTVDEAGAPIDAAQLDAVSATAQTAAMDWSAGRFGVAGIERGTGTKEGVSGYVTVKWPSVPTLTECGRAQVGQDGGWIELEYYNPHCHIGGLAVAQTTIRHELGHAFGYWHTNSKDDVMWGGSWDDPNQQLSARERYHAAIAYSRPIGNVDPDSDPSGTVNLRAMSMR